MARTSGTTIPERERAKRGQGRLTLRLPLDVLALLAAESERSGYTRAELVEEALRIELDVTHPGYAGRLEPEVTDAHAKTDR